MAEERWAVTLRGIAEQTVIVTASSASEAKEKAARAEFEDTDGYPDWVRDEDGSWQRRAARKKARRL